MPRTIRLENWRTDGARICGNGYDDSEGFIKNGQFIRSEPIVGVIMAEDDVTCEAVETLDGIYYLGKRLESDEAA